MLRVLFLSCIYLLFTLTLSAQDSRYVTVIAEMANLRGTPSVSGIVVTQVREGDVFKLIERRGSWFLVETPKYTGWLHGNTLRLGRAVKPAPVANANNTFTLCKLPDMDVYGTCPEDIVPSYLLSKDDKGYDTAIIGVNKVKNPILWEKPEARDSSLCAVPVGEDPAICHEGEIEYLNANEVLVVLDRKRVNNFLNVLSLKSGKSGWVYVGHLSGIYYTRNLSGSIQAKATPPIQTRRPESGTVIASGSYRTGLGKLTISNGTESDAIAKLIDARAGVSYREVYIQSNTATTIENIAVGYYKLIFSIGQDYAPSLNKFVTNATYSKFDSNIMFDETKQVIGNTIRTNYDTYSLTLNKVAGGNAATSRITEAEFMKY